MATQAVEGCTAPTVSFHEEKIRTESSSSTTDKNETAEVNQPSAEEREYLGGIKLILVLGAATLGSFLVMLDMSIIATVSMPSLNTEHSAD
jgi:hypothetical protein